MRSSGLKTQLGLGLRRGLGEARWDRLAMRAGAAVGLAVGLGLCVAWLAS